MFSTLEKLMNRVGFFGLSLSALALGTMLSGVGALAQDDVIAKRKDVMKAAGKAMFGTLGQMARDRKPYDQVEVDAAFTQLGTFGKSIAPLYPESTKSAPKTGDYSASDKVWEDRAGFDAHIAELEKAVAGHKGKIKDLDALKAAFPAISKNCSGCHEDYRLKNS
jgi:cytochrome c556